MDLSPLARLTMDGHRHLDPGRRLPAEGLLTFFYDPDVWTDFAIDFLTRVRSGRLRGCSRSRGPTGNRTQPPIHPVWTHMGDYARFSRDREWLVAAPLGGAVHGWGRGMARVAIVTGGGSGIGQALCTALVRRGGIVIVADINGEAAEATAGRLGSTGPGTASAATVDVRDAAAVAALVNGAVERHGHLDLIFNNAGIGIGGPVEDLSVAHWDRIIDVNLRGVVHGVQAAYPVMVRQGFGHIVNTASLAGLVPGPRNAPYGTTKWAVVGLSLSLRTESAAKGVRVSVICPGGVDTPILDARMPADLPAVPSLEGIDVRALITKASGGKLLSPEVMAAHVMRGVSRNQAIIVAPLRARIPWWLMRLSPAATMGAMQSMLARHSFGTPASTSR